MCAGCLNHILADGRLKNEASTCPNCRIEITDSRCTKNLAVERAVSELPTQCKFCKCDVPRCQILKHEKDLCSQRQGTTLSFLLNGNPVHTNHFGILAFSLCYLVDLEYN